MNYLEMNKEELSTLKNDLQKQYDDYKAKNLNLDMSRGKPGKAQLDISSDMLNVLTQADVNAQNGFDCRNYGILDGIQEMKEIFADLMEVDQSEVFVGGNSSLNLMFDTITTFVTQGIGGQEPWSKQEDVKFLCPVPGYDRHFGITEYYGIKMINVPMTATGPDMDIVEKYVNNDDTIKGMWCVPKYSNPQGVTYSDETVTRLAKLTPKAKDFRIMWDNAYCVHDISDNQDKLLNLMAECKKYGNENLPIMFTSTSKITFPGAGVGAMACSKENMAVFMKGYQFKTIGFDKLNMLRHVKYFENAQGVLNHMQKHKEILAPRFEAVISKLNDELSATGVASYIVPNGGYFVSVDVLNGCAKRVVALCKEAGVVLTGAGATFPYGKDENDSNIRIAPTFPEVEELDLAMELFCLCVKLSACEKLLAE